MFDHLTPGERRHLGAAVHESSHSICAVVHNATIDRAEVLRGGPLALIANAGVVLSRKVASQRGLYCVGLIVNYSVNPSWPRPGGAEMAPSRGNTAIGSC